MLQHSRSFAARGAYQVSSGSRSTPSNLLTVGRIEEVEKRIVGHLLDDGADRAAALVFLLLFHRFHRYVLAFLPGNVATERKHAY